jgi:hypothetical protein
MPAPYASNGSYSLQQPSPYDHEYSSPYNNQYSNMAGADSVSVRTPISPLSQSQSQSQSAQSPRSSHAYYRSERQPISNNNNIANSSNSNSRYDNRGNAMAMPNNNHSNMNGINGVPAHLLRTSTGTGAMNGSSGSSVPIPTSTPIPIPTSIPPKELLSRDRDYAPGRGRGIVIPSSSPLAMSHTAQTLAYGILANMSENDNSNNNGANKNNSGANNSDANNRYNNNTTTDNSGSSHDYSSSTASNTRANASVNYSPDLQQQLQYHQSVATSISSANRPAASVTAHSGGTGTTAAATSTGPTHSNSSGDSAAPITSQPSSLTNPASASRQLPPLSAIIQQQRTSPEQQHQQQPQQQQGVDGVNMSTGDVHSRLGAARSFLQSISRSQKSVAEENENENERRNERNNSRSLIDDENEGNGSRDSRGKQGSSERSKTHISSGDGTGRGEKNGDAEQGDDNADDGESYSGSDTGSEIRSLGRTPAAPDTELRTYTSQPITTNTSRNGDVAGVSSTDPTGKNSVNKESNASNTDSAGAGAGSVYVGNNSTGTIDQKQWEFSHIRERHQVCYFTVRSTS